MTATWDDLGIDRAGEGFIRVVRAAVVRGHRYPVEIIAHRVWLYLGFPLSFREAEELMLEHFLAFVGVAAALIGHRRLTR